MQNFFEWFGCNGSNDKPWLILGKGPSFDLMPMFDTSGFWKVGLNDAGRETAVDVAHAIDIEVIERCGPQLARNARLLVMPLYPHENLIPGTRSLMDWADTLPVLGQLRSENRLLWYDLVTAGRFSESGTVVPARAFSGGAVVNLLATAGAKRIRSLGLDGGNDYSPSFADLRKQSLLSNGQLSFDVQFEDIAHCVFANDLDYCALNEESPIRVFVGASPSEWLPARILEYSIRKRTSAKVAFFNLHEAPHAIPRPKDPKNHARTAFSFHRFLIPHLCGFSGKAIYLDSDMLVFRDLRELWRQDFQDADLLCTGHYASRFSVMLMNCARLNWDIADIVAILDKRKLTYEDLMYGMPIAKWNAAIPDCWNSLDSYKQGETALLHYTDMQRQPWTSRENGAARHWFSELKQSVIGGFVSIADIKREISLGHIRPSVLAQLENDLDDPRFLSLKDQDRDKYFAPPYLRSASEPTNAGQRPRGVASKLASLFGLAGN